MREFALLAVLLMLGVGMVFVTSDSMQADFQNYLPAWFLEKSTLLATLAVIAVAGGFVYAVLD